MTGTVPTGRQTAHDQRQLLHVLGEFGDYSQVTLLGTRALVAYRLDQAEVNRRLREGLTAITSPGALDLLLNLPAGLPVPVESLTASERALLRTVPPGAARLVGGHVIRTAVPPVEASLALVRARSARQGLERAGRFAPFCARAMLLPKTPKNLEILQADADFYGVGLVVAAPNAAPHVVVPPTEFKRNRFKVAGWLFLERLFEQITDRSGHGPGPRE